MSRHQVDVETSSVCSLVWLAGWAVEKPADGRRRRRWMEAVNERGRQEHVSRFILGRADDCGRLLCAG